MGDEDRLEMRIHEPAATEHATELERPVVRGKVKAATRERLEVFVLRVFGKAYVWEIRRNGMAVVSESVETFPSPDLARSAGEVAYMAMLS